MTMDFSYIIIEDEKGSFDHLKSMMDKQKRYNFNGHAANIDKALDLFENEHPDLVFLDVELQDSNGFEFLKTINSLYKNHSYGVIMTTAHDKFGKQAVNHQAIYFLTKPINRLELKKALHQFEVSQSRSKHHLTIKASSGIHVLQYDDIAYLQADRNYCKIVLFNEKQLSVTKPLKTFLDLLPSNFIRVHKSYIVNTNYIKHINTTNCDIVMNTFNQKNVSLGRKYLNGLKQELKF